MENVFISKIKNVLFFIIKSIILTFICTKLIYLFLFIAMLTGIAYGYAFKFLGIQMDVLLWYLIGITTQVFQIATYYFISKKIGIIKTFDKVPFLVLLCIAIVYEIIIIYFVTIGFGHVSDCISNPVYYIKRMIASSLEGYGYLYTFLFYSLKRFKVIEFILQLRRHR